MATLCYGSITTLSRLVFDDGATALTIVALRSALFVLAIGAYLAFARGGIDLPRRAWYASALFALFMGVWAYGYLASIAYIPVSLAALLFFTFPLLVGLFAAIVRQERMTILKGFALLLAFAGLALALGPTWETLDWRGVALVLSASAVTAIAYVFITPVFREHDLVAVNFLANLWLTLGAFAYGLVVRDFALPHSMEGQYLMMTVIVFYIAAFSLWSLALPLIGSVRTAGMMNLEPVISIGLAALILGERLTPVEIGGAALVLLALVLVARPPRPRRTLRGVA